MLSFGDVPIGRQTGDEDVSLALRVDQMPNVTRMHDVEHAVTHDDLLLAGRRPQQLSQLGGGLDLVTVPLAQRCGHDDRAVGCVAAGLFM